MINSIRAEVAAKGGSVLLLSGGDINTGVPESDLQDAEPDFVGMRQMAYDAMALGNHEFDNSLEVIRQQQKWAGFPFLSANIREKVTGKRLFEPYVMLEKQGIKIAVIGLTTDDTAKIGNPEYLENITFYDPVAEAGIIIKELQAEQQPDIIFAVTHMGHYDDAKHGHNAPGDVTLARGLPTSAVTAIIGGHSQEAMCMEAENQRDEDYTPGAACVPDRQNGSWIMQAHEWGKYVGRADFEFKDGVTTLKNYQLIPVNLKQKVKNQQGDTERVLFGAEIAHDKAMLELLGSYLNKGKKKLNIVVGHTRKLLVGDRDKIRFGQTNLGRLVATAQMEKTRSDFGVVNSGGVCASIETGDITYKEVLQVHPFGNTVATVELLGKEVLDYLSVVAAMPTDSGAYAQFAEVAMTVYPDRIDHVKIADASIHPGVTYRLGSRIK